MLSRSILFLTLVWSVYGSDSPRRALWVVRDALKSPSSIDQVISYAVAGRFTDLFVQVRGRGDAYYTSQLVPRAEGLPVDWDPLQYLLNRRGALPIRIHAWINVFYVWSAENNPRSSRHVFHSHPEWSAVSKSGLSMIEEGTAKLIGRRVEGVFLSPSHPDVMEHLRDCVSELVSQYRLDGIHLDYIRYAGPEYDYSDAARAQFLLSYHVDPLGSPKKDLLDIRWDEFRRAQVSRVVKNISELTDSIPSFELSAAVFADQDVARTKVYQDWPAWLDQDLVDFVVIMNYSENDRTFLKNLDSAISRLGNKIDRLIVGVAIYNQSVSGMQKKLQLIVSRHVRHVSVFSYEILRSQPAYFDAWKAWSP